MRTKEKLARVLEAEGMPDLAQRARAGAFDDFESDSATPNHDLYNEFIRRKRKDLAKRVVDGEWDSTREESEAWAASEDGRATVAELFGERPPPVGASGLGVTVEQRRAIEALGIELARECAEDLKRRIGAAMKGTPFAGLEIGFALHLFTFGPGGMSTYVSNAQREDMVLHLRELLDKLERGMVSPPLASQQ